MNRILQIGFTYAGQWSVDGSELEFVLTHFATSENVLYAFISEGEIKYIGKTVQALSKRLYGYQNPGKTQSTNIKNNSNIKKILLSGNTVDIFVLPDNGLLHYGGFHVNLAAGLEDSLINTLKPEWNGKNASVKNLNTKVSPFYSSKDKIKYPQFTLKLGIAYYNQGFINVPAKYSHHLGSNGEELEIYLGDITNQPIYGYINRTATNNGTPRLMGGIPQKTWIQKNFQENEKINVCILGLNSILIKNHANDGNEQSI